MRLIFSAVLLTCMCVASGRVSAHVLLRDPDTNKGATFHLTPDDDPIAGEVSRLYFDIQDKDNPLRIPYENYELQITNSEGFTDNVDLNISKNALTGTYTFPSQGKYNLALNARQADKVVIQMAYVLRVDRGTVSVIGNKPTTQWPVVVMITSGACIVMLIILMINNRGAIANKSRL